MRRLAAGANSGRASTAEKALERLREEGTYVEKPFVPKKRCAACGCVGGCAGLIRAGAAWAAVLRPSRSHSYAPPAPAAPSPSRPWRPWARWQCASRA